MAPADRRHHRGLYKEVRQKRFMNSRRVNGRFAPSINIFKEIDGLIYCYDEHGEMMFFTDDARVMNHSWGRLADGYYSSRIDGKQVSLHRFLSNPTPEELVDHINRNKKDNRLINLRNTTKSVNAFNCKIRKNNTSGITGVFYRKDTKRWAAEIKVNYKKITLGCYKTKIDAIKARQEAEVKYYGNK